MNLTRNYNAGKAKLDFYCLERNYANYGEDKGN